jgi:hypothetical protein
MAIDRAISLLVSFGESSFGETERNILNNKIGPFAIIGAPSIKRDALLLARALKKVKSWGKTFYFFYKRINPFDGVRNIINSLGKDVSSKIVFVKLIDFYENILRLHGFHVGVRTDFIIVNYFGDEKKCSMPDMQSKHHQLPRFRWTKNPVKEYDEWSEGDIMDQME